jgi:hypothetical protein
MLWGFQPDICGGKRGIQEEAQLFEPYGRQVL